MKTALILSLLAALLLGTITAQNRPESQQVKADVQTVDRGDFSRVDMYLRLPRTVPTPTATPITFQARVSFYSNSVEEGTADGRTALGQPTSRGMLAVAYDWRDGVAVPVIPFGTQIHLEGLGEYSVSDTCPACEEDWLDVFEPDRAKAFELGIRVVTATISK